MKRLLFFAALIVAIGSVGGNILTAHAQTAPMTTTAMATLTPAQIAAMKQELQVAEATLINLEMQNGIVPAPDAGTPSTIPPSIAGNGSQGGSVAVAAPTAGLSATQVSAFEATLNALSATLGELNNSVAANTLTPSQEAAVVTSLNSMQGTLVAMANDVATGNSNGNAAANTAPASEMVATKKPASTPVAVNTTPATTPSMSAGSAPVAAVTTTPSTTVVAQTQPVTTPAPTGNTVNNAAPQTAQASSLWSFTKAHWPTIVIVLLVIAILAILFWPEKKESVRTVSTSSTSGSGKPKAPTPTITMPQSQNTAPPAPKPMASIPTPTPPPATPVANAVAAPSQK